MPLIARWKLRKKTSAQIWCALVLLLLLPLVTACQKLVEPDFSVDVAQGRAPLTVQFTDRSTWSRAPWVLSGGPTSWAWDLGDGAISQEQNPSHTYTKAGTYSVTFTATNKAGAATATKASLISVSPGLVHRVELEPTAVTLAIGDRQPFKARAFDQFGNGITHLPFQWQPGEGGTLDPQGLFTAGTVAGNFKAAIGVRVADDGAEASASASVAVKPGPLERIELSPPSAELKIGESRAFTLFALDAYGNPIEGMAPRWEVEPGVGQIDERGQFKAGTRAGTFPRGVQVAVTQGPVRKTTSAPVVVRPDPLERVEIPPAGAELTIGESQTFTLTAFDAYGNPIAGLVPRWEVGEGVGQIDERGQFKAGTRAGTFPQGVQVTLTQGPVTKTTFTSVTVRPGPLERIEVEPKSATLEIGTTQQFTAMAFDRYSNPIHDITVTWTPRREAGSVNPQGRFQAGNKAGLFTLGVDVARGPLTRSGAVLVTIVPDPIKHIQIAPREATLAPNSPHQFTARGFDQYFNEIPGLSFRWVVVKGGGRIDSSGLFRAGSQAGRYQDTVRAEVSYKGATASATATIVVSPLPFTAILSPSLPAPVPGLGYLIYEDDFSANLGWWEGAQDGRKAYFEDGLYHMVVPSSGWGVWTGDQSLSRLTDFSLEVSLLNKGSPRDSKYGIAFNIGDSGQRGFILISPSGGAYFWKDQGPGTYANSIVVFERSVEAGPGASLDRAQLKVERHNALWKISVNDSQVASVTDTAEPLSRMGLEVFGSNAHAAFDNLKVYAAALPRAPPPPQGLLVFSDSFDGWNRGWPFYGKPEAIYFSQGALHLATLSEEGRNTYNRSVPRTLSFAYQAEVSLFVPLVKWTEATPQTEARLALKKEAGTIAFEVESTRQFRAGHFGPGGKWVSLIGDTFSAAIKGQGEVNKLLVVGRGASLEFYANDIFLGSAADPYPNSPVLEIGLKVGGKASRVAFDDVRFYTLEPLPESETQRITVESPRVAEDMATTKRVFAVFAFLHAAGYQEREESWGLNPLRLRVRDALAGLQPDLLQRMKDHYEGLQKAGFGRFFIWNPYGIDLEGEGPFQEGPGIRAELRGTVSLLNEFYQKANLERLWQEVEPEYRAHIAANLSRVSQAGADVLDYLRQPHPPARAFYFVPNLLWPYEVGQNVPRDGKVFMAIAPQFGSFNFIETARHEFLHTALDSAMEKNAAVIKAKEALYERVSPEVKEAYETWPKFVEECLVRAITIRMAALYDPAWQAEMLTETTLRDYFLIGPFLEALKRYEASPVLTFEEWAAEILKAIP